MIYPSNHFQTPLWVCDIMIKQITNPPNSILEPTAGNGNLVKTLKEKFPNTEIIAEYHDIHNLAPIKVDYVVANPPFSPMLKGYEMLELFFKFSKNIIIILPWLSLINSVKRTNWFRLMGLYKVIHLPRSAFVGSRVQTCILVFKDNYHGMIELELPENPNINKIQDR